MDTFDYGQIFEYSSNGEVVIPDTPEVKEKITEMFKHIFGDNFDVSDSSPNGRLIEALTVMFVNILGVIAQNTNGLNPNLATGNWLDVIGAMFGIPRDSRNDEQYRVVIRNSQSRGKGFVQSVWNAVNNVDGVTSVCVLENGYEDPYTFPETGFTIDPHSIFVCCNGGDEDDIAEAIFTSKSAGCGYHMSHTNGTAVNQDYTDSLGTKNVVRFYRPVERYVEFKATVRGDAYTGADIVYDTKSIITNFMAGRDSNSNTTKADLISAIGAAKLGIVCIDIDITVSEESDMSPSEDVDNLLIYPDQFVSVTNGSTTVIVS